MRRPARTGWARLVAVALSLCAALACGPAATGEWVPLAKDGLHDPASPAIKTLQEPAAALSKLPGDTAGNMVRWVDALDRGVISPRTNIFPETKVNVLDQDIMLNLRGGTPMVRFPHRQHTLWLDCSNCHEALFKSKAGANKLSMLQMLQGEQCGLCHGAVSFPLTECNRCHNTPRKPPVTPAPAAK